MRDIDALLKEYLQVAKGKTKAARGVYLTDKAKEILTARLKRFDGIFLFPQNNKDGREFTRWVDYWHLKTIRRLGYKFRLYDCRHAFATRALESGIDLLTLANLLGHANLKMVMRCGHPSEERKAEAIHQMQNKPSKAA